jgi:hypothetical protein
MNIKGIIIINILFCLIFCQQNNNTNVHYTQFYVEINLHNSASRFIFAAEMTENKIAFPSYKEGWRE